MECSCKHSQQQIAEGYDTIEKLRELFIKRMTVDSETQDMRRRDFNQAIFSYFHEGDEDAGAVFCETTLNMVLQCFDDAVKDWRRTYCDVDTCRRK